MQKRPTIDSFPAPGDDQHAHFVRMLSASHRKLLGYLMAMLGRREDAEDVLQRASVILWRKFPEFVPGTDFLAWASTVCFYEAKNFQRVAARSRVLFNDSVMEVLLAERLQDLPNQDIRTDALQQCIEQLDTNGRRLVESAYLDGASIQMLAEQLGRAPQTLYNKLNVIRRLLADCIESRTREAEV